MRHIGLVNYTALSAGRLRMYTKQYHIYDISELAQRNKRQEITGNEDALFFVFHGWITSVKPEGFKRLSGLYFVFMIQHCDLTSRSSLEWASLLCSPSGVNKPCFLSPARCFLKRMPSSLPVFRLHKSPQAKHSD